MLKKSITDNFPTAVHLFSKRVLDTEWRKEEYYSPPFWFPSSIHLSQLRMQRVHSQLLETGITYFYHFAFSFNSSAVLINYILQRLLKITSFISHELQISRIIILSPPSPFRTQYLCVIMVVIRVGKNVQKPLYYFSYNTGIRHCTVLMSTQCLNHTGFTVSSGA